MKNLYHLLVELLQEGANIQTGSLLFTKGSAPQVPGVMAIFDKAKVLSGTLGGGLLEARAQKVAALSAKTGQNILEWVDFVAEMEDPTGAICGGSALFLLDADPAKHLEIYMRLCDSLSHHKSGVLVTTMKRQGGEGYGIEKRWIEQGTPASDSVTELIPGELIDMDKIIQSRIPSYREAAITKGRLPEGTSLFIEPIHPVPRLVIAGAGHIGQALCKISNLLGFGIIVVDDRFEMATSSRFPEASQIICMPLQQAIQTITLTSETYIVIATQGHRTDIEVLKSCICSDAAYIGLIGSKRKIDLMRQKFIGEKWATPGEWRFVHTPVGLNIHARTVNEIAVSILAEIIKERHEINFVRSKRRVCSIVLAAGKSTRMGQQKLLMTFGGKSMVATIVSKVACTDSTLTIVVTGSDRKEIKEELLEYNVSFADNEKYEEGMLSSVQAGIVTAPLETEGFLVFLGDQPMVSEAVINRMISVFRKDEKGLMIPTYKGKRGHPVLIGSKYKDEIMILNPEIGLRELFLNHPDDILEIEVGSDEVLKDIDTPEDYQTEVNA